MTKKERELKLGDLDFLIETYGNWLKKAQAKNDEKQIFFYMGEISALESLKNHWFKD